MPDIALRPRSATELVDAAFQVYRREPLQFIVALALIYVPWLVFASFAGITAAARTGELPDFGLMMASLAGSVLVYALAGGVTIVLADDVYFGRPADVARAFSVVFRRVLTLIVANVLAAILIGLGFLLLIAPAVYLFARLFAISQVILLENGDLGAAFSRTSFLSKGQKWHILFTMLLVFLLNLAISVGASFVTQMIPGIVVRLVLTTIVSVLVYPLLGITSTLLYYDVRIRREGFDIEYLAAAGAPNPPSPAESPAT